MFMTTNKELNFQKQNLVQRLLKRMREHLFSVQKSEIEVIFGCY